MFRESLLSIKDLEIRLRCKKSKIYQMIKEGELPRPLALGPRLSRWRESDIQKVIAGLSEREAA